MKITICGSIFFVKEMKEIKAGLENLGHEVLMPASIEDFSIKDSKHVWQIRANREDYIKKIKPKYTMDHFKKVKASDAILVANFEKKGTKNYIGGATFSEIMLAYVEGKKIFFYNPIPKEPSIFIDELETVAPIILNGNLEKVR